MSKFGQKKRASHVNESSTANNFLQPHNVGLGHHCSLALNSPSSSSALNMGVPPIVHEVLRSPGEALDSSTRQEMESRFGHDFSRVRILHGGQAAAAADAVNARAYTVGHQVV